MTWMQTQAEANEPFLAFLPTNAPHAPLWVPVEDREAIEAVFAENDHLWPDLTPELRQSIIRFLAMIRNLDTYVGQLRDFLRQQQIDRNTILIFMTDNGSTFGPQYYNAGMRGGKVTLWEGGHRVPFFMHWPDGNLGEARDVDGLTQVQDVLPTLIDLCGLQQETPPAYDGISLADVLRGEEPVPADASVRNRSAKVNPPMPKAPTCRKLLRLNPSQNCPDFAPRIVNIPQTPLLVSGLSRCCKSSSTET